MIFIVHSDTCTSAVFIFCTLYKLKLCSTTFSVLSIYCQHTSQLLHPCMGSMACAFMQQCWSISYILHCITNIFLLHHRLPLAYIHQMESDLLPTSYSVSEELHLHSRPHTYAALALHWQLMRMRVHCRKKKKKHVISRY